MNILVTGATGFIGSALLKHLELFDFNLTGISRTGKGVNLTIADFTDERVISPILKDIDVVIHCAAIIKAEDNVKNLRKVNLEGSLNLAKLAVKSNVKRFIFLSSAKVNGETTSNIVPFSYSDQPCPKDSYAISKAEAELKLLALGKSTDMDVVIIRPPLVYGEGVKGNFSNLMAFSSKGIPSPFGAIRTNKRSLVSIYNLIDLIKVCIEHPNAANEIFLVSDDHDISTAEMVALMAKVHGKRNFTLPVPIWCFKLVGRLLGKNDVVDRLTESLQLDINHTKHTLGWTPPYSIKHGFKESVKTY